MSPSAALSSLVIAAFLSACAPVVRDIPHGPSEPVTTTSADSIAATETTVAAIESRIIAMRTVEKTVLGESTEGTLATGYFEGTSLRKVRADVAGETFRSSLDIYLDPNGAIVHVRELEERYDKPMYEPGFKVVKRTTRRYFFGGGTSSYVEENGAVLPADSAQRLASDTYEFASRMKKVLQEPTEKGATNPSSTSPAIRAIDGTPEGA
jgi:hypothetical protein